MRPCLICSTVGVQPLLDFGPQALSNRYLSSADAREAHFPFVLGQCEACGLVQFLDPVPPEELKPRFDWIRYNEAEGHLDDLVSRIGSLPGVSPASTFGGVSFKDDSTLERFRQRGSTRTWRLELEADLGLRDQCAGLESVQELLTPKAARDLAARRGEADVLVVRHVLEHAHQPHRFAAALRSLVKPGGHLVFEVPDCTPALTRLDYTMPWEEHIAYFTPALFTRSLAHLGFKVVHFERYPYANENSLVAITQADAVAATIRPDAGIASHAREEGQRYAAAFENHRRVVRGRLEIIRSMEGPIAIFGAGHLACAWINFLRLESLIEFAVDDHPAKAGLFMPGSKLPILPSSTLLERGIKVCLTSLSAESEAKVRARNGTFIQRGGRFASIFPAAENSLSF